MLLPWSRFFRRTHGNLRKITEFLCGIKPDILGLIEVDAGSYRSSGKNQAQALADSLGHYHVYSSKYSRGHVAQMVPLMNKQGNAFLTSESIDNAQFHYFDKGVKRLVIELELADVTIFLVHLALGGGMRHRQLNDLYSLVKESTKPTIVAGDFNARWGATEMRLFLAATGLTDANSRNQPTYPSWKPNRQLDFMLYSREIVMKKFSMPKVILSDHLPLILDFEIKHGR
jgi:endonuclease/exonuclease/phosphatase family metal-dependent hydrolase